MSRRGHQRMWKTESDGWTTSWHGLACQGPACCMLNETDKSTLWLVQKASRLITSKVVNFITSAMSHSYIQPTFALRRRRCDMICHDSACQHS